MIYLILALLYDKYALCMNFEEMRIEARNFDLALFSKKLFDPFSKIKLKKEKMKYCMISQPNFQLLLMVSIFTSL